MAAKAAFLLNFNLFSLGGENGMNSPDFSWAPSGGNTTSEATPLRPCQWGVNCCALLRGNLVICISLKKFITSKSNPDNLCYGNNHKKYR